MLPSSPEVVLDSAKCWYKFGVALLAGRWKGALVAVKVIDHRIKGNGNAVDIQRETILSTSVVHPNVVQQQWALTVETGFLACLHSYDRFSATSLPVCLIRRSCRLHEYTDAELLLCDSALQKPVSENKRNVILLVVHDKLLSRRVVSLHLGWNDVHNCITIELVCCMIYVS